MELLDIATEAINATTGLVVAVTGLIGAVTLLIRRRRPKSDPGCRELTT